MKAVARLLFTFFAGTRVTRWLSVAGLLLIMASLYVVLCLPQTEHMLAFAVPGLIALFLGTSLMPLMLGRLAQSHAASLLPGARGKLLAAAVLTVLLVSLPVGLLTPLGYVAGMSARVSDLFTQPRLFDYTLWLALYTYTSACIAATWLYVFLWFVSSERSMTGLSKALIVFLVLMLLPVKPGGEQVALLQSNLAQLAILAVVFSAGFLGWPRIRRWLSGRRWSRIAPANIRGIAGKEIDLILGNSQPWPFVAALLLPVATTFRTGVNAPVWLFYLTIASTIGGAFAGQAPARSRALWLRGGWSREALFSTIERSAWRHNGLVLVLLLLMLLAVGSYARMPLAVLATGVALLVLGSVLSTYLGLMLTRGVRWLEGTLGVIVVVTLMTVAMGVGDAAMPSWLVAALLVAMTILSGVLRKVARRRWAHIDWSECRRENQPVLR